MQVPTWAPRVLVDVNANLLDRERDLRCHVHTRIDKTSQLGGDVGACVHGLLLCLY